METVPRRLFLKLTGWSAGVGMLAHHRPGHTAKRKTITDAGAASDDLTVPLPAGPRSGSGYPPGYQPGY